MEIVQVLIFVVIIAIAIVQQITKAKKETATPSPHEVLTDMFPTIEEIEGEGQTVSPRPVKSKPQPAYKKKKETFKSTPIVAMDSKNKDKPSDENTRIKLSIREEARRAFIYSEIFNRKY